MCNKLCHKIKKDKIFYFVISPLLHIHRKDLDVRHKGIVLGVILKDTHINA